MQEAWEKFLKILYQIIGLGNEEAQVKILETWKQGLAQACHERLLKELSGEEHERYQKFFNQKPSPEQLNVFLQSLPSALKIKQILAEEIQKASREHVSRLMQVANEEQKEKARAAFRELLRSHSGQTN